MPTYSYVCEICGEHFEKVLPISQSDSVHICPNGHAHIHRVFSPPAIVFKGSGFYKTDHRPKEKAATD